MDEMSLTASRSISAEVVALRTSGVGLAEDLLVGLTFFCEVVVVGDGELVGVLVAGVGIGVGVRVGDGVGVAETITVGDGVGVGVDAVVGVAVATVSGDGVSVGMEGDSSNKLKVFDSPADELLSPV